MVQDGDTITLVLRPGRRETAPGVFDEFERTVRGRVRRFWTEERWDPLTGEQVEFAEERWEVETGDPQYPAIGFNPETAEIR